MRCPGDLGKWRFSLLLGAVFFLLGPQLLFAGTTPARPTNLRFSSPNPQPGGGPFITNVAGVLRDENEITISGTRFGSHDDYGGNGSPYLCAAWTKFKGWSDVLAEETRENYELYKDPWDKDFAPGLRLTAAGARPNRSRCLVHINPVIASGTAQGGSSNSIILESGDTAPDDYYKGLSVIIVSGAGAGQVYTISDYVASNKTATSAVQTYKIIPDTTSKYEIVKDLHRSGITYQFNSNINTGKWFTSYWIKISGFVGGGGKFWRMMHQLGRPTYELVGDFVVNPSGGVYANGHAPFYGPAIPADTWTRLDVHVNAAPGEENLFVVHYDNKIPVAGSGYTVPGPWEWRGKGVVDPRFNPPHWVFGQEIAGRSQDASKNIYYISDPYISHTFARVELGNSPKYEDCTHLEIQPPKTWNPNGTRITIDLNHGSFMPGDKVYLFVVDANGTASPGYGPITLAQ